MGNDFIYLFFFFADDSMDESPVFFDKKRKIADADVKTFLFFYLGKDLNFFLCFLMNIELKVQMGFLN